MTWRYQATHHTITTPHGPEDVFEVREVYEGIGPLLDPPTDDGLSWTETAAAAISETKEGLIEVLQMMLGDVQEFDVLEVGE